MLGDLVRKLLQKDQPGIQRQGFRDASQMPQGMKFGKEPLRMPRDNGLRDVNGLPAQLPQGMKFGQSFRPQLNIGDASSEWDTILPQNDESNINPQGFSYGVRGMANPMPSRDLQGSLSDYYRLKY